MDISQNINSAIISGNFGIQKASEGISRNSFNLANLSVQSASPTDPQEFLANATLNQLQAIKQTLPQATQSITSQLVGLSISGANAQASSKVLDTANGTVGTILDILA
jgi:hypothetical protein